MKRWRAAQHVWAALLVLLSVMATSRTLHAQNGAVAPVGPTKQTSAGLQAPSGEVPVPGVDREFDERVKAVSTRLRCPVCQGESIQDSPAELSTQMKTLVREQLYNGQTEAQVLDYFVQKYGQWILLEPRAEGINLLVYWLPVVFLVVGGGAIVLMVKKWTRSAPLAAVDAVPMDRQAGEG